MKEWYLKQFEYNCGLHFQEEIWGVQNWDFHLLLHPQSWKMISMIKATL